MWQASRAILPRTSTPILRSHRPEVQSIALRGEHAGRLWLNRWGKPMSSRAIRRQIERRTEQTFGKAIRPHLFRDCAVTVLLDSAPDEIGIAPDLLGHADLQTTRRHYIQAQGMSAHVKIGEMIARRRAAGRTEVTELPEGFPAEEQAQRNGWR